jgi:putative transposase
MDGLNISGFKTLNRRGASTTYRKVTGLLNEDGFDVGHDRVYRIWRSEGLQIPQKQPKHGRLWFNDGSCIRLCPEYPNHVWSYDFVADRMRDGRPIRILNIIDEYTIFKRGSFIKGAGP